MFIGRISIQVEDEPCLLLLYVKLASDADINYRCWFDHCKPICVIA